MVNRSGVKVAASLMILSVIFSVSCKSETETTDPTGSNEGLFDRSAQIQFQVLENLVAEQVVTETETEPEITCDATGMLFEEVVAYMDGSEVVKNWFDNTNRLTARSQYTQLHKLQGLFRRYHGIDVHRNQIRYLRT